MVPPSSWVGRDRDRYSCPPAVGTIRDQGYRDQCRLPEIVRLPPRWDDPISRHLNKPIRHRQ
jgi:hypothetical protein